MIITVEGRPLNGPSTKSNTLKEAEEPLMKGGGGMFGAVLDVAKSNQYLMTPAEKRAAARQAQTDQRQAQTAQRPRIETISETFNPLSGDKPITEAELNELMNKNLGILRGISLQEAQEKADEAIRKAERHAKRMNKIHKYMLSMLMYYLFYLTGPYIRESIGLFFYWFIWIFLNFFSLLMLFIIFNICLIIIMVIQKSLNISHAVVGGIAKGMQTAIDKAGFRIFGKNIKLLGFLQGPTNKIKASDDKIPRTARQVIEAIVFSFFAPYLK